MKNLLKQSSFLIVIFMLSFCTNTKALNTQFTDIPRDSIYYEAVYSLSSVGLISGYKDGSFGPYSSITRAEFTAMAMRAIAVQNLQIGSASNVFSDVPADHWANSLIYTAYLQKIISGFDDKTFKPNEGVTFEQAIKMVVCMLGYEQFAIDKGGWPDGYMYIARDLQITKNTIADPAMPATRGVIAQLLYNSLTTPMAVKTGDAKYEIPSNPSVTILKDKLNIIKEKVVVKAVEDAVIDSLTAPLYKGKIGLETQGKTPSYIIANYSSVFNSPTEAKKQLGNFITVFYRQDFGEDVATLVAIDEFSNKNTAYNINSDDIESFKTNTLSFWKDSQASKATSLKFDTSDMLVIYNGKAVERTQALSSTLENWLNPSSLSFISGDMKIIDAASDGSADVIFIYDYTILVASSAVNLQDYTIADKLKAGNILKIDENDSSVNVTISKDGSVANASSIMENDVILYAKSLDSTVMTIRASSKTETGSIQSIESTDGYTVVTINDAKYKILNEYLTYITGKDSISVGSSGTFYLDDYGRIAYASLTPAKQGAYGYVFYSREADNKYIVSLFMLDGIVAMNDFTLANKVKFNGVAVSSDKITAKLQATSKYSNTDYALKTQVYQNDASSASITAYSQLVRYSLDSSRNIDGITTLTSADTGNSNELTSKIEKYKELAYTKYTALNNFDNQFYADDSTLFVYVPKDRNAETEFSQIQVYSFFSSGNSYWVEPYDVNSSNVARLVLVYGNSTASQINKDTPIAIITKTPSVAMYQDNNVNKVDLYYSTFAVVASKYSADTTSFADLNAGDVIKYGYDNQNRIINRVNILKISDIKAVFNSANYDWQNSIFDVSYMENGVVVTDSSTGSIYNRVMVSNVLEITSDKKIIRVSKNPFNTDGKLDSNIEQFELSQNPTVLLFDLNKNTFRTAQLSEIKGSTTYAGSASKVMLNISKGIVTQIVIYTTE